ncbi:hypothetical protein [Mesorhizobium sp. M0019]|uniref:hypothetical protein n=1 Tax=Mesorhizobium sp. M0019 TaxID=2956845 RepID=UPI00333B6C87
MDNASESLQLGTGLAAHRSLEIIDKVITLSVQLYREANGERFAKSRLKQDIRKDPFQPMNRPSFASC